MRTGPRIPTTLTKSRILRRPSTFRLRVPLVLTPRFASRQASTLSNPGNSGQFPQSMAQGQADQHPADMDIRTSDSPTMAGIMVEEDEEPVLRQKEGAGGSMGGGGGWGGRVRAPAERGWVLGDW